MRVLCLGISHKTADVGLREKLAFQAARIPAALADLASRWAAAEFVVVSTCNRTEVYTARPVHGHPRQEELLRWLGGFHGVDLAEYADATYALADADAVRHLFAVASGLESLVIGEPQIVAQLKGAYAAAVEAGAARAILNELFQTAFHVAKEVRGRTRISSGKVSVASVAVDAVAESLGSLEGKTVLNVGSGKMNELMLRHLGALGGDTILVANRSAGRAEDLARRCGGRAVALESLGDSLALADVVLTSTAAQTPIITREMIDSAQARRQNRPMLIVDIAVPRDVEPACGEVTGVRLYNIDHLERIVEASLKTRRTQSVAAEAIIAEHLAKVLARLNIKGVARTIDALYRRMQEIADEELADAMNKLAAHDDADADVEILRRALHRTVRRIMHPVASGLRDEAGADSARAHVATIRKLFDLDE